MTGGELGRPNFVVGAAGIGILPRVGNVERMADHSSANFVAEQPFQEVFVERQSVLREDGIPKLLELLYDFVIETGIVVIGAAEHHDANAILSPELVLYLACPLANAGLVIGQGFEADF